MTERILTKEYGIGEGRNIGVYERKILSFPLHTHDYCEIELILAGEGVQLLDNKKVPLKRGSVSILTPADCHSVESENGLTLKNISFVEELLPHRIKDKLYSLASYTEVFDEGNIDRLCRISELLAFESENPVRAGYLLEYLFSLFPAEAPSQTRDPIESARIYADTHFREALTVADGARVACLSKVYFGALFKERYGISFGTYVNRKRLAFAKTLLDGGVKVADACFESGFGSVSNFSSAFRTEYGKSPTGRT